MQVKIRLKSGSATFIGSNTTYFEAYKKKRNLVIVLMIIFPERSREMNIHESRSAFSTTMALLNVGIYWFPLVVFESYLSLNFSFGFQSQNFTSTTDIL